VLAHGFARRIFGERSKAKSALHHADHGDRHPANAHGSPTGLAVASLRDSTHCHASVDATLRAYGEAVVARNAQFQQKRTAAEGLAFSASGGGRCDNRSHHRPSKWRHVRDTDVGDTGQNAGTTEQLAPERRPELG
jgi:hypothetical protein